MTGNKFHIKLIILVFLVLIFSSCSTKKKTWVNRQYHNTTAKFNGYFNGNESIKAGIRKLHAKNIDDYNSILTVFPEKNLKEEKQVHSYMDKAIKKGSIVIQRHSIKIKGKEYCKWIDDNYLMVGKAYFYKGDFNEAINTFTFVKNEYSKNEIRFEASLWLLRSYVEKKDFISAKVELDELLKNKKFPDKLNKELCLAASNYYLQKKDFTEAKKEIENVVKMIKRKRKKVRLNYILAQLYQESKNYSLAQKHYKIVLKSNPEYEMAFNAKMSLARSLEGGNSGIKKMKEKLLKMTKDNKNKEYLDQIYFTIAEMEINNKDTSSAIKNYLFSCLNSTQNNTQKSLSFLALGKIDFSRALYASAKNYYDSTIFYMDVNSDFYTETKETHEILSALIKNINIVELQDSLQILAALPVAEQNVIINKIIQKEIEKEREAAEEERLRQQMMYESGRNKRATDQFGNRTSGGKWYFYNPATLSFGMSEFRRQWGKRKLEDDWRRKDKKIITTFDVDTTNTDSLVVEVQNTKNPKYYLNQLPKTEKDFEKSNNKIKEALYQLGVIYKESLNELEKSNYSFLSIHSRFPNDPEYTPLALYSAYINCLEEEIQKAAKIKTSLLEKFPNSVYAKMAADSNYSSELISKKDKNELDYQFVFNLYNQNKFEDVLNKTTNILENKYKKKYLLIRAMSLIKTNNLNKAIEMLELLSGLEGASAQEAKYILEAINDPSKMEKANELAFSGSPYLYRSNNKHMIIIVTPKEEIDITYFKTLISDFHSNSISNDVFEISALLLGLDKHLLMIKSFENIKESMVYYNLFLEQSSLIEMLNKSEYKIMSISTENFNEFYKNKDISGYYMFFKNNYLTTD